MISAADNPKAKLLKCGLIGENKRCAEEKSEYLKVPIEELRQDKKSMAVMALQIGEVKYYYYTMLKS